MLFEGLKFAAYLLQELQSNLLVAIFEFLNIAKCAIELFVVGFGLLWSGILRLGTLSRCFFCHAYNFGNHAASFTQIEIVVLIFAANNSLAWPFGALFLFASLDKVLKVCILEQNRLG